jgi:MFS transporter, putative metabolite:H+ symporter
MNTINAAAIDASTVMTSGLINARLDRLPATRSIWTFVILLSLGGWFEFYDLFFTAYVGPGLVRSGVLTPTTHAFLGFSGMASFVAATFAGLFIGTFFFASVSDKFGRRRIFTISLLWYTIATVIMAFQNDAAGLNFWRFVAGIGVGMEFVTIDSYVAELVPVHLRGRAFVINQMVQYSAVPAVALLAYLLVPTAPFGFAGWRWVVLIGAVGAVFVWLIRRGLPESPRWLAQHGRFTEADTILRELEARVEAEYGASLPALGRIEEPASVQHGQFRELWQPPYRSRTIMLMVFNFFQTIGYYGFASWVPTLLIARGIEITHSLFYSFLIAVANPIGPLFAMPIADRIERKWMIVGASIGMAVFGMLFAGSNSPVALVIFGLLITFSSNLLSCGFHRYQPELFPTRVRARAIGLVYSISRLSAMMSGFMVAYCLGHFGTAGVFALIVGSMAIVCISIGGFGPRTRQARL